MLRDNRAAEDSVEGSPDVDQAAAEAAEAELTGTIVQRSGLEVGFDNTEEDFPNTDGAFHAEEFIETDHHVDHMAKARLTDIRLGELEGTTVPVKAFDGLPATTWTVVNKVVDDDCGVDTEVFGEPGLTVEFDWVDRLFLVNLFLLLIPGTLASLASKLDAGAAGGHRRYRSGFCTPAVLLIFFGLLIGGAASGRKGVAQFFATVRARLPNSSQSQ